MSPKKIYIVGIGGIGLSALAQLLKTQGAEVSGSDRGESPTTKLLKEKEIEVFIGHDAKHVPQDASLLIYSDAIHADNPERMRAQELGIPQASYFEALGKIANEKKVIAVAGAHGKTTTTAMLVDIFEDAGKDPMAVVGSLRAKSKSNFRAGGGEYFIVEADEYMRHFLQFNPFVLVITNIDEDHLDYYRDLSDIQDAFRTLAQKVPKDGFIVCDPHSEKVKSALEGVSATVIDYTKYFDPNLSLRVLPLNRMNAAAALAVSDILKISLPAARQTLAGFTGTWRRFEYKGETKAGARVFDDYAHHPTEIKTTLMSVREQFPHEHIIVAFHPHLYSRTKILLKEFSEAFDAADEVLIAPIFAAREAPDPEISSEILASHIRARGKAAEAVALEEIPQRIRQAEKGTIFITMGAGDIYKEAEAALK